MMRRISFDFMAVFFPFFDVAEVSFVFALLATVLPWFDPSMHAIIIEVELTFIPTLVFISVALFNVRRGVRRLILFAITVITRRVDVGWNDSFGGEFAGLPTSSHHLSRK